MDGNAHADLQRNKLSKANIEHIEMIKKNRQQHTLTLHEFTTCD